MIYINIANFALISYLEKDHSMIETRRFLFFSYGNRMSIFFI